jgi:hypothetical protein
LGNAKEPEHQWALAKGLEALAGRMESQQAAKAAALLAAALAKKDYRYRGHGVAEALEAMLARMESKEAARFRAKPIQTQVAGRHGWHALSAAKGVA